VSGSGEPTGVHPSADLLPMWTEQELNDLAADIKANGLVHPIVLDADGMLIDGRNRLEGCRRAGVEPRFTRLNGENPRLYILRTNMARRNMSQGQRAMGAVLVAEEDMHNLCISQSDVARSACVPRQRVVEASLILKFTPDLAPAVLAGTKPMSEALEAARQRKEAVEEEREWLNRLQRDAPDLAARVQEGRMKLMEAVNGYRARERERLQAEEEERSEAAVLAKDFAVILGLLDPRNIPPEDTARTWLKAKPQFVGPAQDFSAARIRRAAEVLMECARLREEEERK